MEDQEVALELHTFVTHQVQVDTRFGQYVGLMSNFDGRLCWLADVDDPIGCPPVACISLREDWAVRHLIRGCPACGAEEEVAEDP